MIKKFGFHITRQKFLIIFFSLLVNILFIYGFVMSNEILIVHFIVLIFLNIFLFGVFNLEKFLKKLNIENRLDGNLNLKNDEAIKYKYMSCPNCSSKTISYLHALKEPQSCGECGKTYKVDRKQFYEMIVSLMAIVFFMVGFYLKKSCISSVLISNLIIFSGFGILVIYHLIPKKLVEVNS